MFKRTQTYTVKEFMRRSGVTKHVDNVADRLDVATTRRLGFIAGVTIPITFTPFIRATRALANGGDDMVVAVEATSKADKLFDTMMTAFDPLIVLIQAMAYPVANIVIMGGALFIMVGQKEKGFTMIQGAGLGYVLVQVLPLVLDVLVEAMRTV